MPLCDVVSVKVEGEALGSPKIVGQAWLSDDPTCCITCVRGELRHVSGAVCDNRELDTLSFVKN